jgi:hypothetical protein
MMRQRTGQGLGQGTHPSRALVGRKLRSWLGRARGEKMLVGLG